MIGSQLISSPYPNLKVMPNMGITELQREDEKAYGIRMFTTQTHPRSPRSIINCEAF